MSPPARWPLHPRPAPGEALSSWVTRIAQAYGLSGRELLREHLGPAAAALAAGRLDELDWDPPAALLSALATRTGIPVPELARLTLAGWAPTLFETLQPSHDPAVFVTYVHQDSVLLAPGEAPDQTVIGWRAWLPSQPLRRLCPLCAKDPTRGFPLTSHVPLLASCAIHACRLEPALAVPGIEPVWLTDAPGPRPVSAPVAAMDRRTQEGLDTGMVTTPVRPVHLGVWARLLRTLADEITTPLCGLRRPSQQAIRRIWQAASHPLRADLTAWRAYEHLTWPKQAMILEATAHALALIENEVIPAHGSLAGPLAPRSHEPVDDGDRPEPTEGAWNRLAEEISAALTTARADPTAARRLLGVLTLGESTPAATGRTRATLLEVGIPAEFLPAGH
jgi:hypothetical protein